LSGASKSVNELNADLFEAKEDGRFADPKAARKKAMDYLARREYGRAELVAKLLGAGFGADIAESAVSQLTAEGLQDDRRFIEGFAQSRISQGKGPVRVHAELRQKGIDAALVDAVLEAFSPDWRALARDVRCKKFGASLPLNFSDKAKQMRFLQYRGFAQAEINAAVNDGEDD
jgi:regulatory protein